MPGIKDLSAGVLQIKIMYSELANGAQLTFETEDIYLITAIHRWFGMINSFVLACQFFILNDVHVSSHR